MADAEADVDDGGRDRQVAFVAREHPRLVRSLTAYTGDAALAEELAQETLARAVRQWARVQGATNPGGYVHRMAFNLANSHFRRRRAEQRAYRRWAAHMPIDRDETGALDRAVVVRRAVASLPRRQRAALVLRAVADLSVAETAAVMGCAEGTVKALTSQAAAALRRQGVAGLTAGESEQEVGDGH